MAEYKLLLNFTGMVTVPILDPRRVQTQPNFVFVMVVLPTRRKSANDTAVYIEKHTAFVVCDEKYVDRNSRPFDLPPNKKGFAGWLLDKERLALADDPKRGCSIRSVSGVADMRRICPDGLLDSSYTQPQLSGTALDRVGGHVFLESGELYPGAQEPKIVEFRPLCDDSAGSITAAITDVLVVEIVLPQPYFTLKSHSLANSDSLSSLYFTFGQDRTMNLYLGSAPTGSIQDLPDGEQPRVHKKDVDFELYYDIAKKRPSRFPIPHPVGKTPPIAGSDRCPPLING
ncbi:MAG TPA: hypothetical protein VF824_17900 [Thermoanaerobaculia bacterium]|jgi:hypothetical protein